MSLSHLLFNCNGSKSPARGLLSDTMIGDTATYKYIGICVISLALRARFGYGNRQAGPLFVTSCRAAQRLFFSFCKMFGSATTTTRRHLK